MNRTDELREKINKILNNPPVSEYDYFTKFEKDTLTFTEGVRAIIEAADILWAVNGIIEAQRKHSFELNQAWVLYSHSPMGTPSLTGYNVCLQAITRKHGKSFSRINLSGEVPVVSKSYYNESTPFAGEMWFWVTCGRIILPSEYGI